MTRIDCLQFTSQVDRPSQYGVLPHFTQKFHEALLAAGINSRLWVVNKDEPKEFFKELQEDPPLCTVSFNYCIKGEKNIPHVNILVDAPYYFFNQMSLGNIIWTCTDRIDEGIYSKLGFDNIFFLPHAAEKIDISKQEKKYDVVMLSSHIDYEEIRKQWNELYSDGLVEVMDNAVAMMLKSPAMPSYQAFVDALDVYQAKGGGIGDISLTHIFHQIDLYIRGIDRVELVRSIKNARVDIFGSSKNDGWKKYIDQPNVFIHDELPFTEALDVIRQSKVVLNSCPTIRDGAHERVFNALASGALVVSSESRYLREEILPGAIIFYEGSGKAHIGPLIDDYLNNPQERTPSLQIAREIVLQNHTWEQRAKQLVIELVPILEKMKK